MNFHFFYVFPLTCHVFYFLSFFPLSSHQIICISFSFSQLFVMFSLFSISFLCHLFRLFVFFLVFPVICQVFFFLNFFPLSSQQITPVALSGNCCENCKCSSDLLWHLNFLSPDCFVFCILSLCEVFHILKTYILGIRQNVLHVAPGRLNKCR